MNEKKRNSYTDKGKESVCERECVHLLSPLLDALKLNKLLPVRIKMPLKLHLPWNKTVLKHAQWGEEIQKQSEKAEEEIEKTEGWTGWLLRKSQRDSKAQAFYLNIWILFEYQMIAIFSARLCCRTCSHKVLLWKSKLPVNLSSTLHGPSNNELYPPVSPFFFSFPDHFLFHFASPYSIKPSIIFAHLLSRLNCCH